MVEDIHAMHQIRIIYHAEEAGKLTYLRLLDKEGTDIYAHVRRPELQQIQNVADNLLDAEKRVHLSDILKSMDNATLNQLEKDLAGEGGEALRALFGEKVGCVKAWEKLFKEGNSISELLRKNTFVLEWFARQGDDIPQNVADALIASIDKPIKETIEDAQGRLTFVLDRPGQSNKVVSVHSTSTGDFKTTVYNPAYNPNLNPEIHVPLSANRLTPDYLSTNFMHPLQGNQVVKIKLSGNRNTDFARAREELGITMDEELPNLFTWHHMDDFEIINGEAYSTMQLVEKSAHQGTGVLGRQHSGSAAQWRAYFGSGY